MNARHRFTTILIAGLLILVLPAFLLADEPDSTEKDKRIIIISEDGDEVVIEMEDVHEIVAEAMSGVEEVMAELEDMQLQVRLGRDNRLDLSYEDTTLELDLDQIMTQVAAAVREGLDEFDSGEWTRSHDRWSHASDDDLRHEIEDLQKEMKELRRELRKIRTNDDD